MQASGAQPHVEKQLYEHRPGASIQASGAQMSLETQLYERTEDGKPVDFLHFRVHEVQKHQYALCFVGHFGARMMK